MTRLEFLEKSRNIHGYKYDYPNLSEKINYKDKIKIIFEGFEYLQTVEKHLMGRCPEKAVRKITTEEFIEESKKVWGNKYDYSESVYKGSLEPIKIILDGFVYNQRAKSHLDGISPEYNKNDFRSLVIKSEKKYKQEIEEFLNKYGFIYEKNQRINGLNFSFFLIDHRIVIEYYSEYHFSDSYLIKERIKRNEMCEDEFINLIEFSYQEKNILWELLYQNLSHLI